MDGVRLLYGIFVQPEIVTASAHIERERRAGRRDAVCRRLFVGIRAIPKFQPRRGVARLHRLDRAVFFAHNLIREDEHAFSQRTESLFAVCDRRLLFAVDVELRSVYLVELACAENAVRLAHTLSDGIAPRTGGKKREVSRRQVFHVVELAARRAECVVDPRQISPAARADSYTP